jgi:desulfoferrodoxin-like iron-binding protein
MSKEKVGQRYRCIVCGFEVTVEEVGAKELVCCGEEMEFLS